jgi:peptidoglycan hydrolase CwlO-like protein
MKLEYKKLATAIAVITLLGCFIRAYDRFTTVEAMAEQSVKNRQEDQERLKEDINEIKQGINRLDVKIDELMKR